MIPRFGTPPRANQTYTRRPGVYAILPHGDHCLVTCQRDPKINNGAPDIQLPGGGIDPGEHPIRALHREAFEETGWKIANPQRIGCFKRYVYMPEYDMHAEKICTLYVAQPLYQTAAPLEPHHEALWMPIEAAAEALGNPGDRYFLTLFREATRR